MTLAEFFSCALLAYGAPLAMFALTVARDPVRVILTVAAAFGWLLSFLLASLVWFAVVPLRGYLAFGLVVSVIFQEVFRYGTYLLIRKTEAGLKEISDRGSAVAGRLELAYVSGLGFGLMSGAFALVNVLADSIGPGTLGLHSGSEYFLVTSAAATLCIILLNVMWSVVMFSGADQGDSLKLGWVVGSHLLLSCLSLLNRWQMYWATLTSSYLILFVTAGLAFDSAGGSISSLLSSFRTNKMPPPQVSTEPPLT